MPGTATADPLAQASRQLHGLARECREAGDLAGYRRLINILVLVLACERKVDGNSESADYWMVNSRQAAEHIGCHPSTVVRMAREGRLPGARKLARDWSIPALAVKRISGYCASAAKPAYRCDVCNPPKGGPVR